jgi:Flp pilus assembly protein TadD
MSGNFSFSGERLNYIGVGAMYRGDLAGALLLFRLNVTLSPDSMNAYDSLAEAYKRSGDGASAIATYRLVLDAFERDKVPPAAKEELRKKAVAKLNELGAAP